MIGAHLASLNLFREPDGRVFITIAAIQPAGWEEVKRAEQEHGPVIPHDVIIQLLPEGAANSNGKIATQEGE